MNPTSPPNRLLKHTNPQFYIGNTDLTRRILCSGGPYWGPKIHPVGPFLTHFNVAKQAFPATKRPRAVLMCSNAWHCDFIAHIVPKLWNR